MNEVTRILHQIEQGEPHAAGQLLPMIYDELRRLAAHKLAQERRGQTLQATALVHEAYVRLVGHDPDQHWDHRGHFFAAAAEAMRRILVERARRKRTRTGAVFCTRIPTWMTWPGGILGIRWKYWPFTRRWISSRKKRRVRPNW